MDFEIIRARLLEKHSTKVQRLTPLLRGAARDHYALGIQDTIRALQEQALLEEQSKGGAPIIASSASPPAITGPLGVQPSHSAVGGEDDLPK